MLSCQKIKNYESLGLLFWVNFKHIWEYVQTNFLQQKKCKELNSSKKCKIKALSEVGKFEEKNSKNQKL